MPEIGSGNSSSGALVPSRPLGLEEQVKVTVEEPDDVFSSPLLLEPRNSTYRIPRKPLQAPRTIKKLRKKQDRCLADKASRQEKGRKGPKKPPRKDRYCRVCEISCNSATTFYDHKKSKGHRNRLANLRETPICRVCSQEFESHLHLSRHLKGKAHFKELAKQTN